MKASHSKTAWILTHADGRKLNVNIDFSTGRAQMWLDTGGNSPCFDSPEKAQTYIDTYAAAYDVHPTAITISW